MTRVNLVHIGGPTVILEMAGLTFITDPTLDPPSSYPLPVGQVDKLSAPARSIEELQGRIDVVLLSHDQHPDNLDQAGRRLLSTVPYAFSTPQAASRVPGVKALTPWASAQLTGPGGDVVTITGVPARHGPLALDSVLGEVTGFLLSAPGWPTVYISGDNADIEPVAEVRRRTEHVDLAVVHAGAPQLPQLTGSTVLGLTAQGVMDVADLFPDALVVVVHTEGWSHFTESAQDVETLAAQRALGARVRVPAPGTGVAVEANQERRWQDVTPPRSAAHRSPASIEGAA